MRSSCLVGNESAWYSLENLDYLGGLNQTAQRGFTGHSLQMSNCSVSSAIGRNDEASGARTSLL